MLPPVDIADAIELLGRQQGRHARLFWQPIMSCWCIEFSLRPDDPRLKKWQAQTIKLDKEPTESVPLHSWDPKQKRYVAWDIEQRGVSGMIEHLDKANLLSGRGEHNTLWESMQAVEDKNRAVRESFREAAGNTGRQSAAPLRRRILGNMPVVTVPANIGARNGAT